MRYILRSAAPRGAADLSYSKGYRSCVCVDKERRIFVMLRGFLRAWVADRDKDP